MSIPAGKLQLPELAAMKERGDKIVMVTAYDAPGARFAEDAGIDMILVGDTAAMVVLGHSGTTPVTVDEMLFLTRTVSRNVHRPIVVGDLPFGSYETSDEDAVRTAVRFVKEGGADVVKLEGAGPMVSRARAIVERRDRGDGPRRAHAAVGDDARRLQDAGPHGGRGAANRRRREGARGRRLLLDRARGDAVTGRSAHHARAVDPDDRDRRRLGL